MPADTPNTCLICGPEKDIIKMVFMIPICRPCKEKMDMLCPHCSLINDELIYSNKFYCPDCTNNIVGYEKFV